MMNKQSSASSILLAEKQESYVDSNEQWNTPKKDTTQINAEHFTAANATKELIEKRSVKNFDVSTGTSRLIDMTV